MTTKTTSLPQLLIQDMLQIFCHLLIDKTALWCKFNQ
jgi:hypothetical protein